MVQALYIGLRHIPISVCFLKYIIYINEKLKKYNIYMINIFRSFFLSYELTV